MSYVGRFAPSPTGALHLGSLVAALGSYLDARHHGGRWLLRIEDLDTARIKRGCADQIMRTLERFGLDWDGSVEYQSRRQEAYAQALQTLRVRGFTFECHCTRGKRTHSEDTGYPGTCRDQAPRSGPAAIRFRVDNTLSLSFTDRFQGPSIFPMRALGDVVIRRRDAVIAYQLAVVVDDAEQGITDVVRGADLLPSTPWQLLLQQALGLPAPRYAHLPVIVEPDGAKLAKSRRSIALDTAQASRQLVEALELLRQNPPRALAAERPETALSWALNHWNPANLERVQKATAPLIWP